MKTFKVIDFWVQVLIIAFCMVSAIINAFDFFYNYFIVGASQFISMLIHEKKNLFTARETARRFYHNLVYIVVILMLLTPLIEFTNIIFFALLYAAPIMAVYYVWLCRRETFIYMKRPISVLK